jgi:hypothetical protein
MKTAESAASGDCAHHVLRALTTLCALSCRGARFDRLSAHLVLRGLTPSDPSDGPV